MREIKESCNNTTDHGYGARMLPISIYDIIKGSIYELINIFRGYTR
jgi:hypothetical protein